MPVLAGLVALGGCAEPATAHRPGDAPNDESLPGDAAGDANLDDIPRFSMTFYIDLDAIERISRFRSGMRHDFADSAETCRSMKHYFCPRGCMAPLPHAVPWTSLVLRAPVTGRVTRLDVEQTYGTQVHIEPAGFPTWDIRVFHVTPVDGLAVGSLVAAGDPIGTHASENTMSDIAIQQFRPDGFRLVSYIDTLADAPRAALVARGVASPDDLLISAADRDAAPLACQGEVFADIGTIPNWVVLP